MNVLFLRGCKAHFLTMVVDGEGTKQGRGGWRARMGSSRAQRARARDSGRGRRLRAHVPADTSHSSPWILMGGHTDIARGGRAVTFLWGRIKKKWQRISLPIMRF